MRPRVLLLLAAVGLAACGTSDRGDDRYVDQLNEIQHEGSAEGAEFTDELRDADTRAEVEVALEKGLDANEDVLARLEELDPPSEVADEHVTIIELNQRSTALAQEALDAFRDGSNREFVRAAQRFDSETVSMSEELLETIGQINEELGSG